MERLDIENNLKNKEITKFKSQYNGLLTGIEKAKNIKYNKEILTELSSLNDIIDEILIKYDKLFSESNSNEIKINEYYFHIYACEMLIRHTKLAMIYQKVFEQLMSLKGRISLSEEKIYNKNLKLFNEKWEEERNASLETILSIVSDMLMSLDELNNNDEKLNNKYTTFKENLKEKPYYYCFIKQEHNKKRERVKKENN